MKWIALFAVLAMVMPIASWLRRDPRQIPKLCLLLGILPWDLVHNYLAIISFEKWPGHTAGLEFSLIDALALALYLGIPKVSKPLPFRISMGLYFLATLAAVSQADVPMAAVFYVAQLARMFLLYAAVAKACTVDPRAPFAIVQGMAIGLMVQAGFVVFQRVALGMIQAKGTLAAQNFLGVMSHFAVFPVFALLLAGPRWRWIPLAAVAGLLVEIFTTSRATLGLALVGYAGLFLISALSRWTSRKARILAISITVLAVAAPLAVLSFQSRFEKEAQQPWATGTLGSDDENGRAEFREAAALMLADHPWGVGPNHYVIAANHGDYNMRAGVPPSQDNLLALVHNVYWLVVDETGYPGLIAFALLLLQPLIMAFRHGWRNRGDIRGDLLLGIAMALLIVYIHSSYEWIFIAFQSQYMFVLQLGMVVGLVRQLEYARNPRGYGPRFASSASVLAQTSA